MLTDYMDVLKEMITYINFQPFSYIPVNDKKKQFSNYFSSRSLLDTFEEFSLKILDGS